jgi:cell division inhibitor SulA
MITEKILIMGLHVELNKEFKSRAMGRLTPKSILGEIWYASRGLHLTRVGGYT